MRLLVYPAIQVLAGAARADDFEDRYVNWLARA